MRGLGQSFSGFGFIRDGFGFFMLTLKAFNDIKWWAVRYESSLKRPFESVGFQRLTVFQGLAQVAFRAYVVKIMPHSGALKTGFCKLGARAVRVLLRPACPLLYMLGYS